MSPSAVYDSSERCDAPKCHPETRKAVQEEIMGWIVDGGENAQPKNLLWLTGPAGSGKTAIAGAIARICDGKDLLAATFFFSSCSGSPDRRSKCSLVATLANQLAEMEGFEPLGENVLAAIERKPGIFGKQLKSQFEVLVLRPLQELQKTRGELFKTWRVIIIDGLDEVSVVDSDKLPPDEARQASDADQVEILSLLLQAVNDTAFPFRILVSSRPERAIQEFFSNRPNEGHSMKIFLDGKYSPDADIHLFLQSSFAQIRRRYNLSPGWGSEDVIRTIVHNASGQFIYAATVVRFLRSSAVPFPVRLSFVSTLRCSGSCTGENPFAALDSLYSQILQSSPHPTLAAQWIRLIPGLVAFGPCFTRTLLQEHPGQADHVLENLASLVRLPSSGTEDLPYALYHKSLLDFLDDPGRCGEELYTAFRHADELYMSRLSNVFESQ